MKKTALFFFIWKNFSFLILRQMLIHPLKLKFGGSCSETGFPAHSRPPVPSCLTQTSSDCGFHAALPAFLWCLSLFLDSELLKRRALTVSPWQIFRECNRIANESGPLETFLMDVCGWVVQTGDLSRSRGLITQFSWDLTWLDLWAEESFKLRVTGTTY